MIEYEIRGQRLVSYYDLIIDGEDTYHRRQGESPEEVLESYNYFMGLGAYPEFVGKKLEVRLSDMILQPFMSHFFDIYSTFREAQEALEGYKSRGYVMNSNIYEVDDEEIDFANYHLRQETIGVAINPAEVNKGLFDDIFPLLTKE